MEQRILKNNKGFSQNHFSAEKNEQDKSTKTSAGFTLVEIMVVALVFTITIGTVIGVFVSSVRLQNYYLSAQQVLDQTSYAMERMHRFVRMARKEIDIGAGDQDCLGVGDGYNYENPVSDSSKLRFRNYNNKCHEFFLDAGRLKESIWTEGNPGGAETFALTSESIEVTNLRFYISGESQGDGLQARVTIFIEIRERGSSDGPVLRNQTTVSQRRLDS